MSMDTDNKKSSLNRTWTNFDTTRFYGFGFVFSWAVIGICHPLQVIKTRLQTNQGTGLRSIASSMLKKEGIRSFYKGYPTVALGNSVVELIYFTTFERSKEVLLDTKKMDENSIHFTSGLIAEGTSNAVIVPVDIIAQRLMVQNASTPDVTKSYYKNSLDAVKQIFKVEGPRGFFKGWGASYLTLGPEAAIWWTTYGWTKRKLYTLSGNPHKENPFIHAMSGFFTGVFTAFVVNPLDVAKTRLQVQDHMKSGSHYKNFFSALKDIAVNEGLKGLYSGVRAKMLYLGPVSALSITSYETVKFLSTK